MIDRHTQCRRRNRDQAYYLGVREAFWGGPNVEVSSTEIIQLNTFFTRQLHASASQLLVLVFPSLYIIRRVVRRRVVSTVVDEPMLAC